MLLAARCVSVSRRAHGTHSQSFSQRPPRLRRLRPNSLLMCRQIVHQVLESQQHRLVSSRLSHSPSVIHFQSRQTTKVVTCCRRARKTKGSFLTNRRCRQSVLVLKAWRVMARMSRWREEEVDQCPSRRGLGVAHGGDEDSDD